MVGIQIRTNKRALQYNINIYEIESLSASTSRRAASMFKSKESIALVNVDFASHKIKFGFTRGSHLEVLIFLLRYVQPLYHDVMYADDADRKTAMESKLQPRPGCNPLTPDIT